jgi:hypothetical protein
VSEKKESFQGGTLLRSNIYRGERRGFLNLFSFSAVLITLLGLAVHAQPEERAPLLFELESSARAAGLGGTFVALADDESAAYYNPAGLAFLSQRGVLALYSQLFEVVEYLALGGALPGVGFQLLRLDTHTMPVANVFGNPTEQNADYVSQAGIAAAALALGSRIALGGRLKAYQTSSGDWNGIGWAGDLAVLIRSAPFRFGAVFEHLLQQPITYTSGLTQSWPADLRVGAAFTSEYAGRLTWTLTLDVAHLWTQAQLRAGAEVWVQGLGLRLGYNGISLTAGASAHFRALRLDWAYALHPQLPASYLMTLTYRF